MEEHMLRNNISRFLVAGTAACALSLAFTAAAAQALVSHTEITSPTNHAVIVVNDATQGPQVTVTGRAPGANNGDTVDIFCTRAQAGKTTSFKKLNPTPIEVTNQSFSYTGSFKPIGYETCFLRAVPSGTEPADLTPFTGPQIAVDETQDTAGNYQIEGGPNSGDQLDYYLFGAQFQGSDEYLSISSCGLCDSYAVDPLTSATGDAVFYANDALFSTNDARTRSEIQIDGNNAFTGYSAYSLVERSSPTTYDGSRDYANFPSITYKSEVDPLSGNVTIDEEAPFVRCEEGALFGYSNPAGSTCSPHARFVPTGVSYFRRIVQNQNGAVVSIFDTFRSTDGAPHHLDLLYYQSVREISSANQPAYEFPWAASGFSVPASEVSIAPPAGAASLFTKEEINQEEGNEALGEGAITMSAPPAEIKFGESSNAFELHYLRTIPAGGSVKIGQAFSTAFSMSEVRADAQHGQAELSPELSIASPAAGATLTTPAATATGTVTAGGNDLPSTVNVNGQAVPVAPSGAWTAQVPLAVGANTITATTTDEFGLSASSQTTLSYVPVAPPAHRPAPATITITKTRYSASGLQLTVSCHVAGAACAGSLSAIAKQKLTSRSKKGKKKTKIKQITVASGHFSLAAGQTKTIKLKISSAAAALLKRLGSLPLTITLSLDQAAGTHTAITERFTLKPKKPKKPRGKSHKKH
jgi:Glucodextranase, domain B